MIALNLWFFPLWQVVLTFPWTGDGWHQLQLALVVLFHSVISADNPHSHLVVSPSATYACGVSSSSHWRENCTDNWATCTSWCWSVVVVVVSLGMKIWNLHWHSSNLHCVLFICSCGSCMWEVDVAWLYLWDSDRLISYHSIIYNTKYNATCTGGVLSPTTCHKYLQP